MLPQLTIHARDWFERQPIGNAAERLWGIGYSFDYISDHQLLGATIASGKVRTGGSDYRTVAVPRCEHIPLATFQKLFGLARKGATIIFETELPSDVPGWGQLEARRANLKRLLSQIYFSTAVALPAAKGASPNTVRGAPLGKGRILVGDLQAALALSSVLRETITVEHPGIFCIRRILGGGYLYFLANRGDHPLDDWVTFGHLGAEAEILDPMTGKAGLAAVHQKSGLPDELHLQLQPGGSVFVRSFKGKPLAVASWTYWHSDGAPSEITGTWQVKFLEGGPVLPASFETTKMASWTELGGQDAQRFAGSALYTIQFDAPASPLQSSIVNRKSSIPEGWSLDLGKVCQSARVRLNGRDLGTLITAPFRAPVESLKPSGNALEVEVTNVSANRIRDLDRRGVKWKNFYDINFVNLDYKPFDASNWPLTESGLIGPVTLTPAVRERK
jgi:hypothetical protein